MLDHLRLLSLAAALASGLPLAAPLAAQEAAQDAAPQAEAAQADATGDGAEASPEAPAQPPADAPADAPAEAAPEGAGAGPAPLVPYVRETFGDWSLRCVQTGDGTPEPCQLYQLLKGPEGNDVAEVSMFPLPEGGPATAGATIVAPLETLLTEAISISVDGGEVRRYPFSFCNRGGCVARVGFTEEEVDQFRRGREAVIRIVPAASPEESFALPLSLSGFTAGFAEATSPIR